MVGNYSVTIIIHQTVILNTKHDLVASNEEVFCSILEVEIDI